MTGFRLPSDIELRQLLDTLYDGDASVRTIDDMAPLSDSGGYVGTYDADDGSLAGACVCDAALATYASSALSLIPKGGAQQALADGELSAMMRSNLREVLNILSRLLMSTRTPHLRFGRVCRGDELGADAQATIEAMAARAAFAVGVPGYGSGRLWILVH
jgi:hypothetical protein